jgi:hypothetical protein
VRKGLYEEDGFEAQRVEAPRSIVLYDEALREQLAIG